MGLFYSLVGFLTSASHLRFYKYIFKICYRNCGGGITDAMGCRCSIRDELVGKSCGNSVHGEEALGSVQAGNFLSTFEERPYIKEL